MPEMRFTSFAEFWPFYLGEHAKAVTRWFHFVGTTLGLALVIAAGATQRWPLLLVALVSSYALAWISHFFIEKNRPATFKYPAWSFLGDWKMWGLMLSGRIEGELLRLGVRAPASGLEPRSGSPL